MAKHISVTVENGKVTAEPNRLPCGPGDTVEWDLGSSAEAGELRIEFEKVLALPDGELLDNEVISPFTGDPVSAPGRITGTVRTDVTATDLVVLMKGLLQSLHEGGNPAVLLEIVLTGLQSSRKP